MLGAEVRAALDRGGNLIVPVFALERTQELLLDLAALIDGRQIAAPRIFIDSPLASRATKVFARYAEALEDVDGKIFDHPAFHFVEDVNASIRLNSVSGAIVLAASGMCEGGRIRHHLKHNLARRESTILFVGYQAEGSLGRVILDGATRVRLSGEDVVVRAQVRWIDTYSAHADQDDLLAWIGDRGPIAGSLFLSHGEAGSVEALRRLAQSRGYAASVVAPALRESYRLVAGVPAKRTKTGDPALQAAVGRDWQNSYADFASHLKSELARIDNAAARAEAVAAMRDVLTRYQQARSARSRHPDRRA